MEKKKVLNNILIHTAEMEDDWLDTDVQYLLLGHLAWKQLSFKNESSSCNT